MTTVAGKVLGGRHARRQLQRGLTLVELMVALTISLVLVGALVTLVVNNGRAFDSLDQSSRQIENSRYAVELLSEEIAMAGYYGELSPVGAQYSDPQVCASTLGTLGISASPVTFPPPVTGLTTQPSCVPQWRAGTGILALRRMSTTEISAAAMPATPHLQAAYCDTDAVPLVFSDSRTAMTLRQRNCTTASPVTRYVSRIYYVAPCSFCGRDTIPTLKRVELAGGTWQETSLSEGIEEVQYEYGFDLDGNGTPDEFRTGLNGVAGSPANRWENVMAIRVYVLSRTLEPEAGYSDAKTFNLGTHGTRGPFGDRFKRRVHTAVVRLNNPAGLRQ